MKTPHIDEARFASLSLIGSLAVIPAAAAWRSHVIPEHFGWAFGAGLAMFASASLPYLLFPRRIRPATLAGSLWAAAGFWLLFIMMANGSDAYTDPADPRFNRHGSGFLWIGLPLFFAGALIAAIVGTASPPAPALLGQIRPSGFLGLTALVLSRYHMAAYDRPRIASNRHRLRLDLQSTGSFYRPQNIGTGANGKPPFRFIN